MHIFPKDRTLKNGREIRIRNAEMQDAAAILEYSVRVGGESDYLTYGPGEMDLSLKYQEKIIHRSRQPGNWLILMAEIEGELVGLLNFRSGNRPRTRHAGIFGITVSKEYWGLGIGRLLVQSLMNWSKKAGITKINLKVRPDNRRAVDIYRQLGFVEEGKISREYRLNGQYHDILLMGLIIEGDKNGAG